VPPVPDVNFYYVDDSGDDDQLLLSALEVPANHWKACLRVWLGWRKTMWRQHMLPTSYELHSVDFVNGRGAPAPSGTVIAGGGPPPINESKPLRRQLFRQSLAQIARSPETRLMTVYRRDLNKMAAYTELIDWIEYELSIENAQGVIVVDGLDPSYRLQHRNLPLKTRRVIEDAWMKDSAHCQFVQMADLSVHSAFQFVARQPAKSFMWDWYESYLAPIAVPGSVDPSGIKGL
jgi:hypothetical protein